MSRTVVKGYRINSFLSLLIYFSFFHSFYMSFLIYFLFFSFFLISFFYSLIPYVSIPSFHSSFFFLTFSRKVPKVAKQLNPVCYALPAHDRPRRLRMLGKRTPMPYVRFKHSIPGSVRPTVLLYVVIFILDLYGY